MLIIDQLIHNIDEKNCPIVVGLDPLIQFIPPHIKKQALSEFGNTEKAVAECFLRFNQELIRSLHSFIPAVKLQMACYELYGAEGMEVFRKTTHLAQRYGLIVVDDSKRNDIGSTASLYAKGHLGAPPLIDGEGEINRPDFLTINPYMGSDTIDPFIEECQKNNKGLFVLIRTSNPSATEYEAAILGDVLLFEKIALDMEVRARTYLGNRGFSPLGAVVGATWPKEAAKLRELMPSTYFLVPGYGAQGGTARQVTAVFDENGYGALVNSSRGIIFAYRDQAFKERFADGRKFAEASREALQLMKNDIMISLKNAQKLPKHW